MLQVIVAVTQTMSGCEIRQLLPLEKVKSKVWEYFGFSANGEFSEKDKKKRSVL